MILEVFFLDISWEEKSKVLLGPEIFFNDSGDLNLVSGSSFRWFPNSEEEEWKSGWWISILESLLTFVACWEEDGLIAD